MGLTPGWVRIGFALMWLFGAAGYGLGFAFEGTMSYAVREACPFPPGGYAECLSAQAGYAEVVMFRPYYLMLFWVGSYGLFVTRTREMRVD